ncbi:astacin [Ostertagia ostertagi]
MNSKKPCQAVAIVALLLLLLDGGFCLSDNGRTSLIRALRGIDLDERLERLRNLRVVDMDQRSSLAATSMNTAEHEPTASNDLFGGGSIIEKNRLEGVDEYLYEGDINLTEEQLSALEASLNSNTTRQKRQASKTAPLWANKKVFYYFDAAFGDPMKSLVKKALNYISARTCLTFVENATAVNRVRVFSGSGCYSYVGMIGGQQDLSLADGCNTTQNQHNYNKLTAAESINYTPYEYGSVMHYDTRS